jgi:hypothetical protein
VAGGRGEMIEEFTEKLAILLEGKIPEELDAGRVAGEKEQDLVDMLNRLIRFMQEVHDFIIPLSKGELAAIKILPKNFFGSPFKELHSCLLHLTWQANQAANGDYNQRVDFMGDFSKAFNNMFASLDGHEKTLKNKIDELEHAVSHIKKLEGLLPICSHCKKIRVEGGDPGKKAEWVVIEGYISEKTDAQFTHSICPDCLKKFHPDLI